MIQTPSRIVVDVDVGIDDYLALLIFIFAELFGKVKIEAIVCSTGNTKVENSCTNVVRLLEIIERTDIPVYAGASKQFIPLDEVPYYFGSDGFGDLNYTISPNVSIIRKEPASVAIPKLVLDNPNEITLICLGPATNLALSIRLYEKFADSIKELWLLGGNYEAPGNTGNAEFNFFLDPESVYVGLESVKKPIYLVTWETCLFPNISIDWQYEAFDAKNGIEFKLLAAAERNFYSDDFTIWTPCDAFLAAAFISPETIITKQSYHNVTIDLHGGDTRGQLVLDQTNAIKENAVIIKEIDRDMFKELITML